MLEMILSRTINSVRSPFAFFSHDDIRSTMDGQQSGMVISVHSVIAVVHCVSFAFRPMFQAAYTVVESDASRGRYSLRVDNALAGGMSLLWQANDDPATYYQVPPRAIKSAMLAHSFL